MERRTPQFAELHPAAVLGSLLGAARFDTGPASRDAEPDTQAVPPGRLARVRTALQRRREERKPAVAPGR
ncbi:MAG: hypothetical protein ACRDNI_10400 [Gaiellaceae bacterium]